MKPSSMDLLSLLPHSTTQVLCVSLLLFRCSTVLFCSLQSGFLFKWLVLLFQAVVSQQRRFALGLVILDHQNVKCTEVGADLDIDIDIGRNWKRHRNVIDAVGIVFYPPLFVAVTLELTQVSKNSSNFHKGTEMPVFNIRWWTVLCHDKIGLSLAFFRL